MRCFKSVVILLTIVFVISAEDDISKKDVSEEIEREMRELSEEGWRIIEKLPPDSSTGGWIPHDENIEEQMPKRRRLRKRKRRPPVQISITDGSSEELQKDTLQPRRRNRPQRLDQLQESWNDMNEEAIRRPLIRRRLTPVYQPSDEIITGNNYNPLSASIRFGPDEPKEIQKETENPNNQLTDSTDSPNEPTSTTKIDLKTLLKQSGGKLSLSEILQQKNLSLSELLNGNEKAISALTEKPRESTEPSVTISNVVESSKYQRLPPSIGMRKNINRNFEQDKESFESLTSRETLEAQRKRLTLLHPHKDNKMYKEMTKFDVITEPTTEKRIFVPSHPKYYTSLNFKPDFGYLTEKTTEYVDVTQEDFTTIPPTTTTKLIKTNDLSNRISLKPKLKQDLPMTSAKLNKMVRKSNNPEDNSQKSTELPTQAIKISINEIFGFRNNESKTEQKIKPPKNDEPFKMSINIIDLMDQTTQSPKTELPIQSVTNEGQKLKYITAKEEIMEILKDPLSRDKLSRILRIRNMTVEELVAQRERGSSQLHLADIFHNKTREPEPKEEPFVGEISSEYFTNFPVFARKQKSRVLPEVHVRESEHPPIVLNPKTTDLIQIVEKKILESATEKNILTITSFPTYKIETDKSKSVEPFLWKELYPDLFSGVYESDNKKTRVEKTTTELYSENDIQRLDDELDSKFASVSNEKLNVDLDQKIYNKNDDVEVFINLPSGVKSAIVASLAIIGLSLLVFITILIIFKWSQKQKMRLNYCNSLSSRIKSPILESGQRKTIKAFMTETLGRKKNYYKNGMQSMSDTIWENDRKSSY